MTCPPSELSIARRWPCQRDPAPSSSFVCPEETGRRRPAGRLLLDKGVDRVTRAAQQVHQRLGLGIVRHGHGEIGVPREPRLTASGHGEPSDERARNPRLLEIGQDLPQGSLDRRHRTRDRRASRSTRRPGASPTSAPGRSCSHS
jgi:hypothetical protein